MQTLEDAFADAEAFVGGDEIEEYKETLRRVVIQMLLKKAKRILRGGEI